MLSGLSVMVSLRVSKGDGTSRFNCEKAVLGAFFGLFSAAGALQARLSSRAESHFSVRTLASSGRYAFLGAVHPSWA